MIAVTRYGKSDAGDLRVWVKSKKTENFPSFSVDNYIAVRYN